VNGAIVDDSSELIEKWERGHLDIPDENINPLAKPPPTNVYIAIMDALSELAVYGRQISSNSHHNSYISTGFLLYISEKATPQLIQSLKDDNTGIRSAVIDALYGMAKYST
jgi:hypothetical protein